MDANIHGNRCFVTGGAGFIGSHLVDVLISNGNDVTVYDNLSVGRTEFIASHCGKTNFRLIQSDLLDLITLKKAIAGHDTVFHLAANPEARRGIQDTHLDLEQETLVTYNVLEAMRSQKVRRIVFASSGTVYGNTGDLIVPENYGPCLPISLYGAGKLASEGLVSAFCGTFKMQGWIFRFGNVIGSRMTHGAIFDFVHKLRQNSSELEILGDGKQSKPYIYVDDCIAGIMFCLGHSNDGVNVFNLGPSSTTNVDMIARTVVEELELNKVRFKYTGGNSGWPGDVPQFRCDISKAQRLGWQVKYSSDEAVRKAIKEFVCNTTDTSNNQTVK